MSPNVAALTVHPIKSAARTPVAIAYVTRRGLRHDRRWMFVDAEGRFISQREQPRLALVRPTIERDAITIVAPSMSGIRVPLEIQEGPRREVVVWKSACEAISAGREAAEWASDYLGAPSDLVFMPESTERAVNPAYGRAGDVTSFADAYPILLASTSSLDDLCARMPAPLPMDRFRPNVVVSGVPAWDEDEWTLVDVGGVRMRVVKPCDRCVVTTVDQLTAERGVEPLRTLATFRKKGAMVYFGTNAIPDGEGTVRVGDAVTIVSRVTP